MSASAAWIHTIWDESINSTSIDGSAVTIPIGTDELPSEVASRCQTAWSAIHAGLTVTHSMSTGYFTVSASGVFTLDLSSNLASLMGFSTASMAGSSSYTSDQRPWPWLLLSWPISTTGVHYSWHVEGTIIDTDYRQAQVLSGPREVWDPHVVCTEAERGDYLDWVTEALRRRALALWPLVADGDTEATAGHAWRLRRSCLLRDSSVDALRQGPVRRLYESSLSVEVVDVQVLA